MCYVSDVAVVLDSHAMCCAVLSESVHVLDTQAAGHGLHIAAVSVDAVGEEGLHVET